ncbi:MAG: NAD(P)H-dependent oxidoreductase [Candidatus Obscuribacterales bacterium]|nr:NAD(P)H-dependent oxidoreductase [Candidatus Obscuribacterales bacterium]
MSFLVISSSLNKGSRSAILGKECFKLLEAQNQKVQWLDLREVTLPHCDGDTCYADANVAKVTKMINEASCIIVAVAIYNFDVGSSAKNLLELTGKAWSDKIVGFICAAGGKSSYMSVMGIANSLMLDFRSLIIPRYVYADGSAFQGDQIADDGITKRIDELVATAIRLNKAHHS